MNLQLSNTVRNISAIASLIFLILFCITGYFFFVSTKDFSDKMQHRINIQSAAEDLRQSSEQLTQFARSYAITKETKYKKYFFSAMGIRRGEIERPSPYGSLYWYQKSLGIEPSDEYAQKQSWMETLPKEISADSNFQRLLQSFKQSEQLITTEERAIRAIDNTLTKKDELYRYVNETNQEMAIRLLFNDDYYRAKVNIMMLIDNFQAQITEKADVDLVTSKRRTNDFVKIIMLFCLLMASSSVIAFQQEMKISKFINKVMLNSINEKNEHNQSLQKIANTDSLTCLPNRRALNIKLKHEWERSTRAKRPLSIALVDIDHFKKFNDIAGHLKGDECLFEVAQFLATKCRRPSDFVARYGGEEFMILLPELNGEQAYQFLETLRKALETKKLTYPGTNQVTISIGITSLIPNKLYDMQSVVKTVDTALYLAKENGRNRVEFLDSERNINVINS
ncbi:MAG: GGDEF domain-containing protein [Pseudomonadota bacterium]